MRIQHNIMAMNAYRNYNNNVGALSKNLEKLSSGYRINRAGDDAAGLAISEKMRAQITGLDAAQKNVKDGISLVKTAEGALQEVQDMMNRMTYLATQSANGTYDNEVDRANLQKEVDALKTEIDRIADSANFNGQKLLDGSLKDGAVNATYTDLNATAIKGLLLAEGSVAGTNTLVETDADASNLSTFTVNLDGLSHVTKQTGGDALTLKVGNQELKVNGNSVKVGTNAGDKLGAKEIAAAYDGAKATIGGVAYTAVDNGDGTLTFTADAPSANAVNAHYDVTYTPVTGNAVAATAGKYAFAVTDGVAGTWDDTNDAGAGNVTTTSDQVNSNAAKLTVTTKIDGKTVSFDSNANLSDFATAANMAGATFADVTVDGKTYKFSDYFSVAAGGGKLTFTNVTAGKDPGAEVTGATFTHGATYNKGTQGVGTTDGIEGMTETVLTNTVTKTAGTDAYTEGTSGSLNVATVDIKATSASKPNQLANTVLDLSGKLTDGAKITLGNETYTIALGDKSQFKDFENVVYLENKNATEAEIASKLTEVAADNGTFSVSHTSNNAKIGLQQLSTVKSTTDMSTMDKLAGYIGVSTLDTSKEVITGSTLALQIGDTPDSFNQLEVEIGDMHSKALGTVDADGNVTASLKDVDISTRDGAVAAINVIKDAINQVSSTRGDLGAIQNRLEHTTNNLSVMKENITDAESSIRDTDVADEMMKYTKNNILIQSAQAMLAQANQVPQGVLQLLG